MDTILFLTYLFLLHLIGDSYLQPREMGRKKSDNLIYLAGHILIIYLTFVVGLIIAHYYNFLPNVINQYTSRKFVQALPLCNALIHGLIDLFMWKGYKLSVILRKPKHLFGRPVEGEKPVYKYWDDSYFYHTIMTDQYLHYATLTIVYGLLLGNLHLL